MRWMRVAVAGASGWACLGLGTAGSLLGPGDHGATFGGNPVACAAALATLDTIAAADLVTAARVLGDHVADRLAAMKHPLVREVREVRGRGLLRAVELTAPVAPAAVRAALAAGYIINATGPTTLRLAPPRGISAEQLDSFVDALPGVLAAARSEGPSEGERP